jgi:integrase
MGGAARRAARACAAGQAAEMLAFGPAWGDSGLVLTSSVGTVIEPRNLARFFDVQIARAGVRRIRFHDLRHLRVHARGSGGAGTS